MTESLGVAVIGAGMAGRAHAYGYKLAESVFGPGLPKIRLVSIADVYQPLAEDTARRYGFSRADTDWRTVAAAPDIDAVSVVVANSLHREIVEALLAAGKHVLCEKPLAPTIEDAAAMVAAADRATTIARVGFTYRFSPGIAAIREWITRGDLGRPLQFSGQYWCDYGCDPKAPMSWRYKGSMGSGALADVGSHLADVGEFLCGPVTAVGGAYLNTYITERPVPLGHVIGHDVTEVSTATEPVENDDTASYTVEYDGGATGTIGVSRIAYGHPNSLKFEVFAERGAAVYDVSRPAEFTLIEASNSHGSNGYRRIQLGSEHPFISRGMAMDVAGVGFGQNQYFLYQARAFLDEIAGREELPRCQSLRHGLHNMRIQQAVVASARTGTTVRIEENSKD